MTTSDDALLLSEEELETLLEGIDIDIGGILSPLEGPLEGIFRLVVRWFFWIGERTLQVLTTVGGPFWDMQQGLFSEGINAALGVGAWVGDTVADGLEWLWAQSRPLLQGTLSLGGQILSGVISIPGDVLEGAAELLQTVTTNVSGFFQGGLNYLGGFMGDLGDWMEEEIATPVTSLARDVRGMASFLGLPDVAGAAPLIGDLLGDALAAMWERSQDIVTDIMRGGFTLFFDTLEDVFVPVFRPFFQWVRNIPGMPPQITSFLDELIAPESFAVGALASGIGGQAVGGVTGNFLSILLAAPSQSLNRELPFTLLDTSTAIKSLFLGTLAPVDFEFELSSQGFRQGRQDQLVAAARPLIRENELRDLLLRGELLPAAWGLRMDHLGWASADKELLQVLHEIIPGVTDLVRFAVREVFDEKIVTDFQLDDNFPTEVLPFAAAHGLSPDWVHRYWQAHWDLPSPSQGFEMFHRTIDQPLIPGQAPAGSADGVPYYTVIPEETLQLLLRVLDVMPFWRDKLTQIAYTPLSRVDVRRMHAMDKLSTEGVERAYRNAGYSPDDAKLLSEFVEDFNTEEPKAMFRGSALRRYREGYTDLEGLVQELRSLGYSGPEIERIQVGAQLDYETDFTGDMLAALRDGYRKDQLSEAEFREGLQSIGIVPDRIEGWVIRENFRKLPKVKAPVLKPPPALYKRAAGRLRIRELIELFRAERLTELELLDELLEIELPRDLAEATVDFEATRRELRQPPPPPGEPPVFETPEGKLDVRTLREAFRDRVITEAQLQTGLIDLEMPPGQARAFVAFEVQRLVLPPAPPAPPPPPLYQTRPGRVRERDAIQEFRADIISATLLSSRLAELAMPSNLVEALVDFEVTRKAIRAPAPPAEPLPFYETQEGKLRVKTAREAFRGELLTEGGLRTALLGFEMDTELADAFVGFELTRREARA